MFGELRWNPPSWAVLLGQALARAALRVIHWARQHPRRLAASVGALVLLVAAAQAGYRWYESRPKPVTYSLDCTTPALTRIEDGAQPGPVHLRFGGSVAPLEAIGKPVTAGITLTPSLPGEWRWANDQTLTFTPTEDWAVGQEYKVVLDRSLFPDHVLLSAYELNFQAPAFSVVITELQFYEDPRNPKERRVVATLSFSHPVDPATLVRNLSLSLGEDKGGLLGSSPKGPPFNVTYDKLKGQAWLQSDLIPIPDQTQRMTLTVGAGVRSTRGGAATQQPVSRPVDVPGMYSYFHPKGVDVSLVRNDRHEPEQVLVLTLSTGVTEAELRKHLQVWLLPRDRPASHNVRAESNANWMHVGVQHIDEGQLIVSKQPELGAVPTDQEHATLHSFRFQEETGRYLYVRLKKGMQSAGGYVLAEDYNTIVRVPEFPEEVSILHEGALLSMTGEKKVTVMARDVKALRFSLSRVLPNHINHLVTQTEGRFTHPEFSSYRFDAENISESFNEVRSMRDEGPGKAQYAAFDLTPYLTPKSAPSTRRGLFFFKVEGWRPDSDEATGVEDARLLLVTDLGLVVKDSADGSHDVFVQGLGDGLPAQGVTVSVLGKNGVPVVSATTDADGHVAFPKLTDFHREQTPTVYLARRGEDFAFLPFDREDRRLDFSRFDVGGVHSGDAPNRLSAFLFSDRGIYRPGDTFHVGMVVKALDWSPPPAALPLEVVITDPRGLEVHTQPLSLSANGMEAVQYTTEETSPTGNYQVYLYLPHENGDSERTLLGSTSVRVEEFLPDRMRITTGFSVEPGQGWVSPVGLKGKVALRNLFGIPAAGRRVVSEVSLTPAYPRFGAHPDYLFHDPLRAPRSFTERLEETTTDENGQVEVALGLEKFEKASWRVSFLAEGYEAEGGRGVSAEASLLVSPLPYLVGFKPDGGLSYVSRGAARSVDFIAVNPQLKKVAVQGLKAELVERRWVSVLTQQSNGTYRYKSVRRDTVLRTRDLPLGEGGFPYALSTEQPGDFVVLVKDAEGTELSRVEYSVAGHANLTRTLEKNAELQVKLSRADYAAGEDIELSIKAPYTGAGLITIERERVYAWKWFKTDATSSVQTIRVPRNMEGNGYVNVTFVRAMDSQEIFMSPLSYGVVPFSLSRDRRAFQVTLDSAMEARPGEPYRIRYRGDRPGKVVVFAVDEGILQVAGYQTPEPREHFLQKRALEVSTLQILDLLLPEFSISKAVSAMGGDSEGADAIGKNLNPFKRKRDKPVAYWSGILDIDTKERELVYPVPAHFNGELRVMAVAVGPGSVGSASHSAVIRAPLVITPSVPTFVAPGDEFTVGVAVANGMTGSGRGAEVVLELKTSEHLEVLDEAKRPLKIDEGREEGTAFRVRARTALGSGNLSFTASHGKERAKQSVDLSVRPPVPFLTSVVGGHLQDGKADVAVPRKLYGAYRTLEVSASPLPLGLARGLSTYLEKYPYGCTEQLVSRALPAVVLKGRKELLGPDAQVADASFASALQTLRSRQNDEGAFGLWAANAYAPALPSVYALHFLTEAKERGFAVPPDLLNRGLTWLGALSLKTPANLAEARNIAYAQYVLTRNGTVSSKAVASLRLWLDTDDAEAWRKDLTAAYLAATYKLLKQDAEAEAALKGVRLGVPQQADYAALYDGLVYDSQVLFLLSRHFPERLDAVTGDMLVAMARPITEERFNTLSSAYAILGLDAYARALGAKGTPSRSGAAILEKVADTLRPLAMPEGLFPRVAFSGEASAVRVEGPSDAPLFFQVTQAGFDLEPPTQPIVQKLEVQRELRGLDGQGVTEVPMGGEVEVHLKLRALGASASHVAITDLLPGGFEVVMQKPGEAASSGGWVSPVGADRSTFHPDYVDVREDRVVLYGTVNASVTEYIYRIKATNAGQFVLPPAFAEGMYDRSVRARSVGTKVTVSRP